jgi:hypothetical protein
MVLASWGRDAELEVLDTRDILLRRIVLLIDPHASRKAEGRSVAAGARDARRLTSHARRPEAGASGGSLYG